MLKLKKIIASAMSLAIACTAVPMTASMTSSATSITFLQGDIDGDSSVGLSDLIYVERYLQGNIAFNNAMLRRADIHENAIIDMNDYNKILNCATGVDVTTTKTADTYTTPQDETITYLKHNLNTSNTTFSSYTLTAPEVPTTMAMPRMTPANEVYEDFENTNVVYISTGTGSASGFIVDDHVIATAAHCVCGEDENGVFRFDNDLSIQIWGEDSFYDYKKTYIPESIHIPANYYSATGTVKNNSDYALLYFEEDLSEYGIWSIGYTTNEFIRSGNKEITICGFADTPNYYRQYSNGIINTTGSINYRFSSTADVKNSMSGGVAYYESEYGSNNTIKTVIGIVVTGGNYTAPHYETSGYIRITPTVARFLLDNPNL